MTNVELAQLYLRRAQAFLEAANRVVHCEPDHQARLHAPSLLLVGFGYEILFKSVLLTARAPEQELIGYGHDLNRMWNDGRLDAMRAHFHNERQLTSRLDMLSDFHSKVKKYTLRYPNLTPTLEAEIDPLMTALEELIELQARAIC